MRVMTDKPNLTGARPADGKVQLQTMNPWDEIPERVKLPTSTARLKVRGCVI